MLSGLVLVILAAFAPWAVVRLFPLAELATGAAGSFRGETAHVGQRWQNAGGRSAAATVMLSAGSSDDWPDPDPSQPADGERAGEAARAETGRLAELPGLPAGPPVAAGSEAEDPFSPQPKPPSRSPASERSERIPGTSEMWQRDDLTWRPVTLGFDDGWPPPSLESGEDPPRVAPDPPGVAPDPPGVAPDPPGVAPDPPAVSPGPDADRPADDHDPLPPGQEPEDGSL
jgi:hypothetical protein